MHTGSESHGPEIQVASELAQDPAREAEAEQPGAMKDAGMDGLTPTPLSPSKAVQEDGSVIQPPASPAKGQDETSTPITAPCKLEAPAIAEVGTKKVFVVETHHETEEVIERLLDVKGLEQSVTGLWGWMSGSVSKVAEQATKVAESASKVAEQAGKVAEKASQQASVVAERATQQAAIMAEKAAKAKALAEQQAKELAAQVSKTMEDRASEQQEPDVLIAPVNLPWETAHPERRAEARERVLKLSMDDHTFTVPPPKEAQYMYDAASKEPYAARMLDTDALLSAKRFKLVPKVVDEKEFWRNYFYRVDLILSALGVPAAATPKKEEAHNALSDEKSFLKADAVKDRDLEEEMRKEIAMAEASHLDDSIKEDENFDMLDDDLEFEDDAELEKSLNDLKL